MIFPKPLQIRNGWVSNTAIQEYLQREISDNSCNTAYLDERSIDTLREIARKSGKFQNAEAKNTNFRDNQKYRFKVGLSFPGENRDFIRDIADILSKSYGQDQIFYDEYHQAELARLDLDINLGDLYRTKCELVIPFFSADYQSKKWCRLEWRYMRDIIFKGERLHAVMPFRLDSTKVDELLGIDGYIDAEKLTPAEVAAHIEKRLNEIS